MRVTLLHYAAPPVVGGVESVLAAQAGLLTAAGHDVTVIAGRGAAWRPDVRLLLIPLVDSTHESILRVKAALDRGNVPGEFDELRARLVAELSPTLATSDAVIAHNVASLHKNLPLTAALHALTQDRSGLILWHHDLAATTPRYAHELHPGYPWDLVRAPWPWALQVTISTRRRDELAGLLGIRPERIHVVPNGVDAAAFLGLDAQTQAIHARLRLDEAAPLLLMPVRLTPRKNVELALHSLAALRERMPRARLLVTGPLGPHNPANRAYFDRLRALRDELGQRAAAHFLAEHLEGFAPDSLIAGLYRMADALLLPSREEGFGIPLLEAGLARLPVFCTDIPQLRELGGPHGTYFSPDAPPAQVADLIARRLEASPEYGLAVASRTFAWQRIFDERIAPLLQEARSFVPATGG